MKFIAVDFDQHEVQVLIESLGCQAGDGNVRLAHFARSARDEVLDPVLWLEPLVEVLVPREHNIYAVFQEQRLQYRAQLQIRTMPLARRIQWMVEEADLPFLPGIAQLLFQPRELRLVHVVAVEGEKPY